MNLEDHIKAHEQWLLSIDSNLDRITASQAAIERSLTATNDALAVVAQNQSNFSAALVSLTHRLDDLTASVDTRSMSCSRRP